MDDLVQFLRDRLDEDYEAARVVLGVNSMAAYKQGKPLPRWVPSPEGDAGIWDTDGTPRVKFVWARERDHIIRHDPARVLAEVEAKRWLLTQYVEHERMDRETFDAEGQHARSLVSLRAAYLDAVRALASVYADHPAFKPEWRP